MDLLNKAWDFEKNYGSVQEAINKGLPKTKIMEIPFRMEMSGFARLEKSIPVIGDIEGEKMRMWIVDNIAPVKKIKLKK